MLSMEVSQLIEQCRQGSADALGELYNAYAQRMKSKEAFSGKIALISMENTIFVRKICEY